MTVQRFRLGPNDERILLGDYQRGYRNEYRYNTAVAFVYSADGDTLASVVSDSVAVMYFFTVEEYGTTSLTRVYFSVSPRVLYHPAHGLVMTTGLEPEFQCFGFDGRLQRVIRLDIPPEPVTSAEREAVRSYLRSWIQETEDERSRTIRQKELEHVEFQDPKAYFEIRYIDEYGYIWAARPEVPMLSSVAAEESPTTCLIISPEGEYLGDTVLPTRYPQYTQNHFINVQENEETGVMEVIVYSIIPAVESLKYP